MTIKELNNSKLRVVRIDPKLSQLAGQVLFPEKVETANKVLNTVKLPASKKSVKIKGNSLRSLRLKQDRV